MRKIYTLIVFCFLGNLVCHGQTWNWARSIGNKDFSSTAKKILPLDNGQTLMISDFLDGSTNSILVVITDKSGVYNWVKLVEGNVNYLDADLDSKGNVYLLGYSSGYFIKYDSLIIPMNSEITSFVIKINPFKQLEWIKIPTYREKFSYSNFIVLEDNSLIFSGTSLNPDNRFLFIDILDNNLEVKTQKTFQAEDAIYPRLDEMVVDNTGNFYLMGSFIGKLNFSDSIKFETEDEFYYDYFIIKLDKNLNAVSGFRDSDTIIYTSIVTFDNKAYVTGRNLNTYSDFFIKEFDNQLNLKNINSFSRLRSNNNKCIFIPNTIKTDETRNLYVAVTSICDNFSFGNKTFTSAPQPLIGSQTDAVVMKFNSNYEELTMWPVGNELSESINDLYIVNEDCFLITGDFSSEKVKFGDLSIFNNSPLNADNYRTPFAFYASYGNPNPATGIKSPTSLSTTLFPNPTSDFLNIQWNDNALISGSFDIFSLDGKLVSKQFFPLGLKEVQIDVRYYPKGMYLVRFSTSNGDFVEKFVKN